MDLFMPKLDAIGVMKSISEENSKNQYLLFCRILIAQR